MTEEQALCKLTALCSQAEYCQGDMLRKMEQWGLGADAQQHVMDYLLREGYVDDSRYCRCFVEDKIKYNGWGRRKIEQALYAKRVGRSVYGPVLDGVADEQYVEVLRPLLAQKWRGITARNDYERSMKLIRFAMGRGYSYDIIKQSIDHLTELPDE